MKIQYGPGNALTQNIGNLSAITDDMIAVLGANPENVEFRVDGSTYDRDADLEVGPDTVVDLVQRANSKARRGG